LTCPATRSLFGAFHGFDAVAPKTALAPSFIASQLAFLRRAFDSVLKSRPG
jgi:hypothetical protein